MQAISLAHSGNDSYSQRQFLKADGIKTQQLDMFLVYEVNGQPCWFGGTSNPIAARIDQQLVVPFSPLPEFDSLDSDNWRVQELLDNGAWHDIHKLQSARESLHEEVFEFSGIELDEVRKALKIVVARIRELTN